MAELLGLVSGGAGLASLAIQLGDNALRLRRFYKRYKNAPTTLEDAADKLEWFQELLSEVEKECELRLEVDFTILNRCITMCRKSIKGIGDTVNKLESIMDRSKRWGKFRTAAEDKEICRLSNNLQEATISLTLAYFMYSESQRKQETERQQVVVAQDHNVDVSGTIRAGQAKRSNVQFISATPSSPGLRTSRNGRRFYRMTFKFQPWFASTSWEFSMRHTYAGWNLSMHTTYVIPDDSLVFYYAMEGNVSALKKLFASGRGIPNVCNSYGWNLLECILGTGDLETIHYVCSILPRTGQEYKLFISAVFWPKETRGDLARLLMSVVDDEDVDSFYFHYLDKECLEMIQNMSPGIFSVRDRWKSPFDFAMSLSPIADIKFNPVFNATGFLWASGASVIDSEFARATDRGRRTALHFAADAIDRFYNKANDACLVDFVRALRLAGADLNPQDTSGWTPLFCVLQTALGESSIRSLVRWVTILHKAGIDLLEYGLKERATVDKKREWCSNDTYKLLDIKVGEKPEDFDIWLQRISKVQIREVYNTPGEWTSKSRVPTTICWYPDRGLDTPEYGWVLRREFELPATRRYLLSDVQPDLKEMPDLWRRSQDDAGLVALAMDRRQLPGKVLSLSKRRRSHSQPALHRLQDHDKIRVTRSRFPWTFPDWRMTLHSCALRSEAICCLSDDYDPRHCLSASHSQDDLWERVHNEIQDYRREYVREIEAARLLEEMENEY